MRTFSTKCREELYFTPGANFLYPAEAEKSSSNSDKTRVIVNESLHSTGIVRVDSF